MELGISFQIFQGAKYEINHSQHLWSLRTIKYFHRGFSSSIKGVVNLLFNLFYRFAKFYTNVINQS